MTGVSMDDTGVTARPDARPGITPGRAPGGLRGVVRGLLGGPAGPALFFHLLSVGRTREVHHRLRGGLLLTGRGRRLVRRGAAGLRRRQVRTTGRRRPRGGARTRVRGTPLRLARRLGEVGAGATTEAVGQLGEDLTRLTGQLRQAEHGVLRGHDLRRGGEVAAAAGERVGDDAEEHPEPGPDEDAGEQRTGPTAAEDGQHEADEQTEPGSGPGTGARGTTVGQAPRDAFHHLQAVADDGDVLHREVLVREEVDGPLRLRVGGVPADRVPRRRGGGGDPLRTTHGPEVRHLYILTGLPVP